MLPENTILGCLTMLEYYEYTDFPLFFLVENKSHQYFLALLVEDSFDFTKFIYAKVPSAVVDKLRANEYDIYTAFCVKALQKYIVTLKDSGDTVQEVDQFDQNLIVKQLFVESITKI